MCTRERYRIESKTWLHGDGSKRFWIVDGRTEAEKADPRYFRVSRTPCGKCLECKLSDAKSMAFRCVKEAQQWENNIMITLTYDDENVPRSKGVDPKTGEIYDSLTLPDHEEEIGKFMKRLRKKMGNGVRFYGCGEYGSHDEYVDSHGNVRKGTERPHYHIILFNCKFDDMRFDRWSRCEWNPKVKNALYKSKILDKLWGKGHADLNEVNFETCRYVAGYVTKKYTGPHSDEYYEQKGQKKPYTFGSRRPGIGYGYFEKNKEKFFEEKPLWAITRNGLKKVKSRYFDKLMEKEDPRRWDDIKFERRKKSDEQWEKILQETNIDKHTYIENQESKVETRNRLLKMRN